jgi:hypothetical protein
MFSTKDRKGIDHYWLCRFAGEHGGIPPVGGIAMKARQKGYCEVHILWPCGPSAQAMGRLCTFPSATSLLLQVRAIRRRCRLLFSSSHLVYALRRRPRRVSDRLVTLMAVLQREWSVYNAMSWPKHGYRGLRFRRLSLALHRVYREYTYGPRASLARVTCVRPRQLCPCRERQTSWPSICRCSAAWLRPAACRAARQRVGLPRSEQV